MLRTTLIAILPVCTALAQIPPPAPAVSAELIRGGVYFVKGGSGANTGFIVGKDEVIAIDSKMTEDSTAAMVAQIRKLTPNPIKYVVLTHSDGDHVNGLNAFPRDVTVIGHANTKKDMTEAFQDPKMGALLLYLPSQTAPGNQRLDIKGARLSLLHFGPAHTSGDLVVYVPAQKLAFVGDLLFIGRDPLIHRQKGGTSAGLVQTLQKLLALDADTYLAGHNDPLKKSDIQAELTSLEEKRSKIKEMVAQGKSLDEVKTAYNIPADAQRRFPSLVEVIYQELAPKK